MKDEYQFRHNRLDAYRLALELAIESSRLCKRIPYGSRRVADQLHRASTAIPLLIAEGANRGSAAQKRQRYTEARGEAAEVAAAIELLFALKMIEQREFQETRSKAARISAMLTGLMKHARNE